MEWMKVARLRIYFHFEFSPTTRRSNYYTLSYSERRQRWRLRSCFAPFRTGNGCLACVQHDSLSRLFCAFVKKICSFSINSDYARINCLSCNLLNSFSIMFSLLLLYSGFFFALLRRAFCSCHIAMLRRLTNGNANTIPIGFAAISGNIVCGVALVRRLFNVLHSQRNAIRHDGENKQRQGSRVGGKCISEFIRTDMCLANWRIIRPSSMRKHTYIFEIIITYLFYLSCCPPACGKRFLS